MAFLGPSDILITEKNTGNIMRAVNGVSSQVMEGGFKQLLLISAA